MCAAPAQGEGMPVNSFRAFIVCVSVFFQAGGSAFEVAPALSGTGQALEVRCREGESECQRLCGDAFRCLQAESPCPRCAGTGSLRLKRILDAVGVELRARPPERSPGTFIDLLTSGGWISIHSRTLYNYGSRWNGAGVRTGFRRACESVSGEGGEAIVILSVESGPTQPGSVLGVLCPSKGSGEASWWGSSWEKDEMLNEE